MTPITFTRIVFLKWLRLAASAVLALLGAGAFAQYPDKPIRLIVPYPAGGGADALARAIADGIRPVLGQPVIVDNRPGASSNIGVASLLQARPDGYTLLQAENAALLVNEHLFTNLPYKPDIDFSYVGAIGRIPVALVVHPAFPATTLAEFIAKAKASETAIAYASAGYGTPHHVAMELFAQRAGLTMAHVPYKGAAPALQDVMGGQVPAMMLDLGSGLQAIRAGKVRALAIALPQRARAVPELPTFGELGVKQVNAYAYLGLVGPAGMPPGVVQALNAALANAVQAPGTAQRLAELGVEVTTGTPAQFRSHARSESARWGELIRSLGLRIE